MRSGSGVGMFALSAIAHDLRAPLAALRTSSELLVDDFEDMERGQMKGMVEGIHRRALWLQGLVENVLAAAVIGDGRFKISRSPMHLGELVADVQQLVEPLLAQKRQTLDLKLRGKRTMVDGDRGRLSQVLENLVLNASKFSPEGTRIDVSVESRGDMVKVSVADRGPGLPAGQARQLFEPFFRGGTASKEGLGLGLSIVKTIMDAHGGEVGARNRPGGGALFWFELEALPEGARLLGATDGRVAAKWRHLSTTTISTY